MSPTEKEAPALYAAREPIFPRRVSGFYRNLKWGIMAVTLGIYYLLPWIRWERSPSLPDQAVLVDLAHRRFFFFWIEIWPQQFYLVAGLLVMAGLGLFLFTSALGRVWCGYACPQTVWTDLFITVERWIEGDRNARIRLQRARWDLRKTRLRLTKWTIWLLIAVATGGAWVFYFADAPTLLKELVTGQAPMVAYGFIGGLTFTTFLFGGFMREQVCMYMCPWPRIQAAMMDEDTLTVAYRSWRGEPRGKHRKSADADKLGDCIDCMACVNVCPMGIDIRDGQQMECITCALCIDACDAMMAKIGKPRGLIDYMALTDEEHEKKGEPPIPIWKHIFRVRTIVYTVLWAGIGAALIAALFLRSDIDIDVSPLRNPLYVTLSDGSIRNTYKVRIRNMNPEAHQFRISVIPKDVFRLAVQGSKTTTITVAADATGTHKLFVIAPPDSAPANAELTEIHIWVKDLATGKQAHAETVFTGKKRGN